MPKPRPTTEVLHDHLAQRFAGDLEGDIDTNYSDDIVLLSNHGVYRGHDGVRESGRILFDTLGPSQFAYNLTLIEERWGYLEWSATSSDKQITDGADSIVVEDGLIVMQTVHYTIQPRQE